MAGQQNEDPQPSYVIVVGTSAGGFNALSELVAQLDAKIDAAFFIVMHLSHKGVSDFLVHRLQQHTKLQCSIATNGAIIERGKIYVGPPNFHLLVRPDQMLIGRGPEENRWRPSIDVLFRSAAASFDGRTIGVILTGLLDDGTSGMMAIQKCGGKSVVQDPNEAEYPDMPLSILNSMKVDACVSLSEMGATLSDLTSVPPKTSSVVPENIKAEAEIAERVAVGVDLVDSIGEHTIFTCPDCGGSLWKVANGNLEHYRCYIGHTYSERDLSIKQAEELESTLWMAIRMMEERRNLLKKMESEGKKRGLKRIASDHADKAIELEFHINKLKEVLFASQNNDHT